MPARYERTQIGYLTIYTLGGCLAAQAALMAVVGFHWVYLAALVVLAGCLALFATLSVQVDETAVRLRFGPGLIGKTFWLGDVESCRVVRNKWYHGWGINLIPGGWLYNVSGLDAVELQMKTGKKNRIGTDDPTGLASAIQQTLAQTPE